MAVSDELGAEREVALDGGKVRYRERGDGAPIVFVHPIFTNGDHWRDVVPPLADQYRCITPDWPLGSHEIPMEPRRRPQPSRRSLGWWPSSWTALDLRDVTLVGNDTGGAISQLVVAGHPERVGRVVLVSCDAFEVFPPRLFAYLKLMARTPGASFVAAQSCGRGRSAGCRSRTAGSRTASTRPPATRTSGRWRGTAGSVAMPTR